MHHQKLFEKIAEKTTNQICLKTFLFLSCSALIHCPLFKQLKTSIFKIHVDVWDTVEQVEYFTATDLTLARKS